jgi:hypothetical protein
MDGSKDLFFTQISSQSLEEMIERAKGSVILAAPGIQLNVATALVKTAQRLGKEMVIVCLDVSEHAIRLGYGVIQSVELLKAHHLLVQHVEHLRFALIVVDGKGYSFTPNALYLESDAASSLGFNAIKLTPDQVREATVRLSPAAKAVAIAQCDSEETKRKLQSIATVIEQKPVEDSSVTKIGQALKEAPPQAFNVSRQVRVYNAYLQYVEVSMTGAAIQRQKITMPKSLLSLGTDNTELEGRFKTSFDLLAKDNELSSRLLEKELKEIRDKFTASLGKDRGRVLLKRNKPLFMEKISSLEEKLKVHSKSIEKNLENSIDDSKAAIAAIYVPILKANPSEDIQIELGNPLTDDAVTTWVLEELNTVFPKATHLIKKMEIRYDFKDITYETLNKKDFLDNVKREFKYEDWDKAYQESIAAAGKMKNEG